jgi:ferredoxin
VHTININQEKCIQCKQCIEVCPANVLSLKGNLIIIENQKQCVSCGHCAAVCPKGAITCHPENSRTPFQLKKLSASMKPEKLLFHKKRSIRQYRSKAVSREVIDDLIQHADKAPSSHNFRRRTYHVVDNKDQLMEIEKLIAPVYRKLLWLLNPVTLKIISLLNPVKGKDMYSLAHAFKTLITVVNNGQSHIFRNAPAAVFIAGPSDNDQSRDDCIAAQHYLMLYGETIGIGSCVIGFAQHAHKKIEKYLKLPKGSTIYGISVIGYPKYTYKNEIIYPDPDIKYAE